jgi:magnesium-transporting ATPase (P-type)
MQLVRIAQENRTEQALAALRDLSGTHATVICGAQRQRIPARGVACGDFLVVDEGDRVAADGLCCLGATCPPTSHYLLESPSQCEQVPVERVPDQTEKPEGDDLPFLFPGTLIIQDRGFARVLATGPTAKISHISVALTTVAQEATQTQEETTRIVMRLAWLALSRSRSTFGNSKRRPSGSDSGEDCEARTIAPNSRRSQLIGEHHAGVRYDRGDARSPGLTAHGPRHRFGRRRQGREELRRLSGQQYFPRP